MLNYLGPLLSPESDRLCNVVNGRYLYMNDLARLDTCAPRARRCLPARFRRVATPVDRVQWRALLCTHPDSRFVDYVLRGFEQGFRIGLSSSPHRRTAQNFRSAATHASVVRGYFSGELEAGRIVGPVEPKWMEHVSPCGVIPKPHQPGRWRLITDLSAPRGSSVNDGIDASLCSLSYARIDDAVAIALDLGASCLLAKLDLHAAYRQVPVHPEDRPFLAVRWQDELFLDAALPFGLRSAPKIFSAVADAVLWIMARSGVSHGLHYLDDFLFLGNPGSDECARNLAIALSSCSSLGLPVAPHKVEGPSSTLVFLGIEIDTVSGILRLPADKLQRLRLSLRRLISARACTKRQLLSLVGLLHHAATVVRPGRSFTRRLIDLSTSTAQLDSKLRLNRDARADLAWWDAFVGDWNGVSLLSSLGTQTHTIRVQSDASGLWGCGAVIVSSSPPRCFSYQWSHAWRKKSIAPKEMFPVLAAACLWEPSGTDKRF